MTSLDRIILIINKESSKTKDPSLDKLRNVLRNNKAFLDKYYDKQLENLISNNPKAKTDTLVLPIDKLVPTIKGMILNDSKFQVFPTYQEFGIHVFNTYIRLHPEDRQVLKTHIDYSSLGKAFTNGDETYVFKDTDTLGHGSMVVETLDGSPILTETPCQEPYPPKGQYPPFPFYFTKF